MNDFIGCCFIVLPISHKDVICGVKVVLDYKEIYIGGETELEIVTIYSTTLN